MFVDTHAHLDFDLYNQDREKVIQRAIENQVQAIITIGTDLESSKQAVILAEKYASIFAAVGIHPNDCALIRDEDYQLIRELTRHEKVIALGEIGLDYHHMHADKETQKNVFRKQIRIARDLGLPIIVHNRDSHEDLQKILLSESAQEIGGVLHSFSGEVSFLEKIIKLNFHISFTGNITFKKSSADILIKEVPVENLLLETDSPFLTPVPLRGKRNEPAFVVYIAQKIAEVKNMELDLLAKITTENAKKLFRLNI